MKMSIEDLRRYAMSIEDEIYDRNGKEYILKLRRNNGIKGGETIDTIGYDKLDSYFKALQQEQIWQERCQREYGDYDLADRN